MNVKKIVIKYLEENEFDGLCCDFCGGETDDLMPCDSPVHDCKPGYRKECKCMSPDCENYSFGGWCIRGEI